MASSKPDCLLEPAKPSLKTVDVEDGHLLTHTLGKGHQDKNQPQTSAQAQFPEFAARFIPQRIPPCR